MRSVYILGNWKMNQGTQDITTFCDELNSAWNDLPKTAKYGVAPQALHLPLLMQQAPKDLMFGAQNSSEHLQGAFTGENSPAAIKDLGASFTLVGHSERRQIFKEGDTLLNTKAKLALGCDLTVVFCVGETDEEREAGSTEAVLAHQLEKGLKGITSNNKLVIAYEPVWAIGTGKTATPEMAQQTHAFIRTTLAKLGHDAASTAILYGGSVKPDNVEGLLSCPDIDGALVGGASLKAKDFLALCRAGAKRNA